MLRVQEQRVKGGLIEGVGQFQIIASVSFLHPGIPSPVPWKGSPRRAGDFPLMHSTFEGVSGNPLLGLTGYREKSLKVIETERGPIAPFPGLILERPREGRREERTLFADILPDRRFDAAASQRIRG